MNITGLIHESLLVCGNAATKLLRKVLKSSPSARHFSLAFSNAYGNFFDSPDMPYWKSNRGRYINKQERMRARIDSRFATAKETGNVLGVSSSRVEKLIRLTRSTPNGETLAQSRTFTTQSRRESPKNAHWVVTGYFKASNSKDRKNQNKRRANKKSASRKRHSRGKVAKASR